MRKFKDLILFPCLYLFTQTPKFKRVCLYDVIRKIRCFGKDVCLFLSLGIYGKYDTIRGLLLQLCDEQLLAFYIHLIIDYVS